jgi:hypothetical protein
MDAGRRQRVKTEASEQAQRALSKVELVEVLSVMREGVRTIFAALVFAGAAVAPAFSQFPFQDRDRPEFMRVPPTITIEASPADIAVVRVPLPRARPKMSIPLPRPAPGNTTVATTPVAPEPGSPQTVITTPDAVLPLDPPAEPVTVAPPAAGGMMMPIPQMPILPSRPASETTATQGSALLPQ